MFTIKRTDEFNARLLGVYEMREDFGPGWRLYYVQRGALLIVMLGGGAKRTRQADIATAKARAATIDN